LEIVQTVNMMHKDLACIYCILIFCVS
jgi:hypothetical protein